ncbi:MAG: SDR family oxidoreductase [Peptococcaceae bacterium]|jgi:3-oxoacyl-[acyl-carrier protein] reductase|nr:SDR family oxidoreductase [Peptococcaceae bacterium]
MKELLTDRVAFITGAGSGMGKAMAELFSEEGAKIVATDINEANVQGTIDDVKKKTDGLAIKMDVTKSDQIKAAVGQAIAKFGKIDILVNCAGGVIGKSATSPTSNSIVTLPEEDFDLVIGLNLKSAFLVSQNVAPHMIEKKYGKIINISSLGAVHPPQSQPHYHPAKAALLGLTYDLAVELGQYGICANAIMPGVIKTAFYDQMLATKPKQFQEEFFDMLAAGTLLKRVGTGKDIANVALFLSSELSDFVTGAVIYATGGAPLRKEGK